MAQKLPIETGRGEHGDIPDAGMNRRANRERERKEQRVRPTDGGGIGAGGQPDHTERE